MTKFSKIALFYYIPYIAFLIYWPEPGAVDTGWLSPRLFYRLFDIYFFGGLVIVPMLAFGLPTIASVKAAISSDQLRGSIKRKLRSSSIALIVGLILVLTRFLYPPRGVISTTINILLVLLLFSAIVWVRFTKKDGWRGL